MSEKKKPEFKKIFMVTMFVISYLHANILIYQLSKELEAKKYECLSAERRNKQSEEPPEKQTAEKEDSVKVATQLEPKLFNNSNQSNELSKTKKDGMSYGPKTDFGPSFNIRKGKFEFGPSMHFGPRW